MRNKTTAPTKPARVEIIPLIDVIFFLLATFVLISLAMTRHVAMSLEFPDIGPPPTTQDGVTIKVASDGSLRWNLDPIASIDSLRVAMETYKRDNPNARILIQGEEASDFGKVVEILDEARSMGLRQVSVQTKAIR